MLKNTHCSCIGPGCFQGPHIGSQTSVTLVSRDPMPSSALGGHQAHMCHIGIHVGTHTHTENRNKYLWTRKIVQQIKKETTLFLHRIWVQNPCSVAHNCVYLQFQGEPNTAGTNTQCAQTHTHLHNLKYYTLKNKWIKTTAVANTCNLHTWEWKQEGQELNVILTIYQGQTSMSSHETASQNKRCLILYIL